MIFNVSKHFRVILCFKSVTSIIKVSSTIEYKIFYFISLNILFTIKPTSTSRGCLLSSQLSKTYDIDPPLFLELGMRWQPGVKIHFFAKRFVKLIEKWITPDRNSIQKTLGQIFKMFAFDQVLRYALSSCRKQTVAGWKLTRMDWFYFGFYEHAYQDMHKINSYRTIFLTVGHCICYSTYTHSVEINIL